MYEVATDYVPNILKQAPISDSPSKHILEDSQFLAKVLMFYDGVCLWEEDSQTPVLHAEWAKKLVQSVSKFSASCRSSLQESSDQSPRIDPNVQSFTDVRGMNSALINNDKVKFSLRSSKMRGIRSLLTTENKLNTSAIKLQLTAQSQVSVPKSRRRSTFKTDDYLYDYEAEIEEEEMEDERKRRKRARDNDDDYYA